MTGGPWTRSMKVVHGPLVHDLSSPTSDYTYELELERRCMFNWSFLPMDSTNSNVLFRFDDLHIGEWQQHGQLVVNMKVN